MTKRGLAITIILFILFLGGLIALFYFTSPFQYEVRAEPIKTEILGVQEDKFTAEEKKFIKDFEDLVDDGVPVQIASTTVYHALISREINKCAGQGDQTKVKPTKDIGREFTKIYKNNKCN